MELKQIFYRILAILFFLLIPVIAVLLWIIFGQYDSCHDLVAEIGAWVDLALFILFLLFLGNLFVGQVFLDLQIFQPATHTLTMTLVVVSCLVAQWPDTDLLYVFALTGTNLPATLQFSVVRGLAFVAIATYAFLSKSYALPSIAIYIRLFISSAKLGCRLQLNVQPDVLGTIAAAGRVLIMIVGLIPIAFHVLHPHSQHLSLVMDDDQAKKPSVSFRRGLQLMIQLCESHFPSICGALILPLFGGCVQAVLWYYTGALVASFLDLDREQALKSLGILGGLGALKVVLTFSFKLLFEHVGEKLLADVKSRLFGSLMIQEPKFIMERGIQFIDIMPELRNIVKENLAVNLPYVIESFVQIVLGFVFAIVLSWPWAVVVLWCVPLIIYARLLEANFSGLANSSRIKSDRGLQQTARAILDQLIFIKTSNCTQESVKSHTDGFMNSAALNDTRSLYVAIAEAIDNVVSVSTVGLVLATGYTLFFNDDISLPAWLNVNSDDSIPLYASIIGQTYMSYARVWRFLPMFHSGIVAMVYLCSEPPETLLTKRKPLWGDGASLGKFEQNSPVQLPFSDCWHSSKPWIIVITDLRAVIHNTQNEPTELRYRIEDDQPSHSISIPNSSLAGQFITVQGESGVGKSTFLKLIYRFLVPTNGTIQFQSSGADTISQRMLSDSDLWSLVMVVDSNQKIVGSTISNFLLFGFKETPEDPDIIQQAMADAQLSNNFLSKIVEKLSDGERQRVILARIFFRLLRSKWKHIVLLDESTRAVDDKTHDKLMKSFDKYANQLGHLFIHVSHRDPLPGQPILKLDPTGLFVDETKMGKSE